MKQIVQVPLQPWCNWTVAYLSAITLCVLAPSQVLAQGADFDVVDVLPDVVVDGATIAVGKGETSKKSTIGPNTEAATSGGTVSTGGSGVGNVTGANDANQTAQPFDSGASPSGTASAEQLLQNQGSAVTVVTSAQLKAQQIRHAADALRSLPGVTVSRSGSFSGVTQVRLRGAEGNHTLVLIDGIEVNDVTNGEFDFSDLSAHDIEKIEVIRGGQSSLYGAGAVGGVINIVTRSGKGPLQISTHAEAGSFATREGGGSISAGNDDIWGRISFVKRDSGGFNIAPVGDEDDGSTLANFSFRGGARLVKGVTLDLTLRKTEKNGERDTEDVVIGQLQQQTDDPATFDSNILAQGARLTWEAFGGTFTHVLSANRSITKRNDTTPTFVTDTEGERFNYRYTGTAKFATPGAENIHHTVTGLVGFEEQLYTTEGSFADGITRRRERLAFAGEWLVNVDDQLFVTGNIRHDDNSTFEDFTTWRASASWRLANLGLRPHASVGTAVKEPTMFEQFGLLPGFFTPNPNLIPEESFGWDAGVEWASRDRKYSIDVTYFKSDLTNQINGLAPGPNFTFTAVNRAGRSHREGIEVAGRVELFKGLSLHAAYTYLDTETFEGLEEFRRPHHAGRGDLRYVGFDDKLLVNVSAIYNGEMIDPVRRVTGPFSSIAERLTLDDYWVLNAAAAYRVAPGIEMFGRVENFLNEDYQEIFGFEAPPIAAYAGLRFTYVEENTRAWAEGH